MAVSCDIVSCDKLYSCCGDWADVSLRASLCFALIEKDRSTRFLCIDESPSHDSMSYVSIGGA